MTARLAILVACAVLVVGCVSGSDASNGAVRLLNAVPDAPGMNLLLDGELRIAAVDYAGGSAFIADRAGQYQVSIAEILPTGAASATRTIFDQPLSLAVNDEATLAVVGSAAAGTEEIIEIRNTSRGVPFGQTRLQFLHAAPAGPAADVYVIAPDGSPATSAPFAQSLGFRSFTGQQELPGGSRRIVLTQPGDPAAVLLDSGPVFLTLEGTFLVALLENTGTDAARRPFVLSLLTGTNSGVVRDKDTTGSVRFVNAAPAAYAIDAFVNETGVDDTARQACDPLTPETGTLVEACALPYEAISPFSEIAAGVFDVKLQKTGADAVAAQVLTGTIVAGFPTSLVVTGLTADNATATTQGLLTLAGARRIATAAQLRVGSASLAADATVAGDPATDRLELFITAPGASLADESPDFINVAIGSDTGYQALEPGAYEVILAKRDTAVSGAVPELLLTLPVTLAGGGVYTLIVTDSVGGALPLGSLSIEDDAGP